MSLLELPNDLLIYLLTYSDTNDQLNLLLTCKKINKLAYGKLIKNRVGWLNPICNDKLNNIFLAIENNYLFTFERLMDDPRIQNILGSPCSSPVHSGITSITSPLQKTGSAHGRSRTDVSIHLLPSVGTDEASSPCYTAD